MKSRGFAMATEALGGSLSKENFNYLEFRPHRVSHSCSLKVLLLVLLFFADTQ